MTGLPFLATTMPIWLAFVDHGDSISSFDRLQAKTHGLLYVLYRLTADEMRQNLGVGIGSKHAALLDELRPQRRRILDDPVVHHRDLLLLVDVGVGIDIVGLAVGRPARVTDSHPAAQTLGEPAFQLPDLARRFVHAQAPASNQGHPGRVVAAVFQAMQARQQDGVWRCSCRCSLRFRTCLLTPVDKAVAIMGKKVPGTS